MYTRTGGGQGQLGNGDEYSWQSQYQHTRRNILEAQASDRQVLSWKYAIHRFYAD